MGRHIVDLTGQRFGRLVCVKDAGRTKKGQVLWFCRCDCGCTTTTLSTSLVSGNTKSCGCLKREIVIKRNTTHGLTLNEEGKKASLYGRWRRIKQRCLDKNCSDYERYGGRGVIVCKEWLDYKNFYEWAMSNGYRKELTVERIDNNGDYEPSNCTWIPPEKQAKNKRNNHRVTYKGKRKILAEWSRLLGIKSSLLRYRLKTWSVEKAFNTPIRRLKNAVKTIDT